MTGGELLAMCRTRLRDTSSPQLWEDDLIYTYLNQAERIFAERTHILQDFTSFTVTTIDGIASYALDPSVIAVLVAQIDGEPYPLQRINSSLRTRLSTTTSVPERYTVIGGVPVQFVLSPPADGVQTLNLGVAVRPSVDIAFETAPTIPAEYHLDLVEYVVQECFVHPDADGFAPELSDIAGRRWITAVNQAKRDMYTAAHTANTVVGLPNWTGAR